MTQQKSLRFERFEIDVDLRQLTRDGRVVTVQPKVFDLLLFLIDNRHRVVSKDELQDAVWPGTVVTESALSRAIMKARRAIGDDNQSLLTNVHGRGYRFAAEPWSPGAMAPKEVSIRTMTTRNVIIAAALGILVGVAALALYEQRRQAAALQVAERVADIRAAVNERRFADGYRLFSDLSKDDVESDLYAQLRQSTTDVISLITEPSGASVSALPFGADLATAASVELGATPLQDVRIGRGDWLLEIRKDGFRTLQRIVNAEYYRETINSAAAWERRLALQPEPAVPAGQVFVPGGDYELATPDLPSGVVASLDDFLIDKYETSNQDYRQFIADGGYENAAFWPDPLPVDVDQLRDSSGMAGPRSWSGGTYGADAGDLPVSDINWYEATAYCRYRNGYLPSAFQWEKTARDGTKTNASGYMMPWGYSLAGASTTGRANYNSGNAVAVTEYPFGISPYGAFNMAGNVREWVANAAGERRLATGGDFAGPSYIFAEFAVHDAAFTAASLGFRCAYDVDRTSSRNAAAATRPIEIDTRTPTYYPVDEMRFRELLRHYQYDRKPANAQITETVTTADWTRERITYDGIDETVTGYLWLPTFGTGPYQTIVFVPGADTFYDMNTAASTEHWLAPLIRGGRAIFVIAMRGMIERELPPDEDFPATDSVAFRQAMIDDGIDLRLGLDYVTLRDDIDADALVYLGFSWGAGTRLGFAAIDNRYKAVIFIGGGIDERHKPVLPAADNVNFAPYIGDVPKLLLNGRHDEEHPWYSRGLPLWNLLQSPKTLELIPDVGHMPPERQRIPIINDFLDRHIGPVNQ